MGSKINFRPHHFMCTLGFAGKGYSPSFIKNYDSIYLEIHTHPDTEITITNGLDSICKACPHQRPNNKCDQQSLIEKLDQNHSEALQLGDVKSISWNDAKKRIKKNVTVKKFNKMCAGCKWQKYGMCEKALKKLLADT